MRERERESQTVTDKRRGAPSQRHNVVGAGVDLQNGSELQSRPSDRRAGADAGGRAGCMCAVEDGCLKLLHAGRRKCGKMGGDNGLE